MTTSTCTRFTELLDELVREVLGELRVEEPPVDAIRVARGLGVEVRSNAVQGPRGRIIESRGRVAISVRPEPRSERLHWAVAREIGHYLISRSADRWPADLPPADATVLEWLSGRFAAHLLAPVDWYAADCRRLDHDLIALKLLYRTASFEVLALRWLDVRPESIVTIFDKGRLTRRASNLEFRTGPPHASETACRLEAARSGEFAERTEGGLRVRAWPIHQSGWRREILLTECNGFDGARRRMDHGRLSESTSFGASLDQGSLTRGSVPAAIRRRFAAWRTSTNSDTTATSPESAAPARVNAAGWKAK